MKLLAIILCLFSSLSFYAQESLDVDESNSGPGTVISFSPQYFFVGGMHFDLDFRTSAKSSLVIAPTIYFLDDSQMFPPDYISYVGVGLGLNYRYYPSGKGIYTSFGFNYKLLNADYNDYSEVSKDAVFNTYGFDVTLGYQIVIADHLVINPYFGWGFRYSTEDSSESSEYWGNSILSLAYSGFLPVAGLRIGMQF